MTRNQVAIILLVLALVATNAFWAYRSLDAGVTITYQATSLREHKEALSQTIALIPVVAQPCSTRGQILEAARARAASPESFDKDGFTWVGQIGLRFGPDGRILEIRPSWDPF